MYQKLYVEMEISENIQGEITPLAIINTIKKSEIIVIVKENINKAKIYLTL